VTQSLYRVRGQQAIDKGSSSRSLCRFLCWVCLLTHRTWQLSQNSVKFLSQPLHIISWFLDKFHNFLILFVFYTTLKQLDHKFAVMLHEHGVRNFWYVPKLGRNLCSITWISFLHSLFSIFRVTCRSNLNYPKKNSIKWTKYNRYSKHFNICVKIEDVDLEEHTTKGWEKKKKTNKLCRVSVEDTRSNFFAECLRVALGKDMTLSSVFLVHST
jgi:hypothetical protein